MPSLECQAEIEILQAALPKVDLLCSCQGTTSADVDASALQEALGNLVHDAATYGDDAPVTIALSGVSNDFITLAVGNAGPTIRTSQVARMLKPLHRGGQPNESSRTNLGLGLFIVEQIAYAHGGSIECVSSSGHTVFEMKILRCSPTTSDLKTEHR